MPGSLATVVELTHQYLLACSRSKLYSFGTSGRQLWRRGAPSLPPAQISLMPLCVLNNDQDYYSGDRKGRPRRMRNVRSAESFALVTVQSPSAFSAKPKTSELSRDSAVSPKDMSFERFTDLAL